MMPKTFSKSVEYCSFVLVITVELFGLLLPYTHRHTHPADS